MPQPMALIVVSADAKTREKSDLQHSLAETLIAINEELEKHERLQKLIVVREDWTIENGLLTPSLKIKRDPVEKKYQPHYDSWYNHIDLIVIE
jgi:long-chain acyl-CoA synthetase